MHRNIAKKKKWTQHVTPDFPNAFIRLECVMEIARSSRRRAQNNAKDRPKWKQKSLKIGSWRPLGSLSEPLGRLLGAFWGQLQKNLKKLFFCEANLGARMQRESIKINVKKKLVVRPNFFPTFFEFLRDLGLKNIVFFNQMLVWS